MTDASTTNIETLNDLLAHNLPQGVSLTCYHVSTPPTKCDAIFSALPGARAERTYCESHFLSVSISPHDVGQNCSETEESGNVLAFAIEVLIYTTSHLTTIFVSKADSTGYLSLLQVPRTSTSPIRVVSTTFISWLVRHRQRPATRLVVSLFARSQDQYLFPGSIENTDKHVAGDAALIKWWCKVLDPVVRAYAPEESSRPAAGIVPQHPQATAQGHLLIPGLELNETMPFFPSSVRSDPPGQERWKHGHPLHTISKHPNAPPRCLVPHFPDDPKSRYIDELDDELPYSGNASVTGANRGTARWRSVHSLEQFWEMMSYRQECSSGRLVGFIWVVLTPPGVASRITASSAVDRSAQNTMRSPKRALRRACKLSGPIIPRVPRIKRNRPQRSKADPTLSASPSSVPETSRYYAWPSHSRGTLILDGKKYKRATDLLLHHNFAKRRIAAVSTRRWIEEVGVLGGRDARWGVAVVGRQAAGVATSATASEPEKKRKSDEALSDGNGANILGPEVARKKPKTDTAGQPEMTFSTPSMGPSVNILSGSSIIRKKPKA